jgi:hypothetical protein
MNKSFTSEESVAMDSCVQSMILSMAITPCTAEHGHFVSPIFLVPKPDGSKRFIINLKRLNEHLVYKKFKMEDLRSATRLLDKGCFMASIDLKDAYYAVPIEEDHRKYLRFRWKGQLYQFNCLPFGLSVAPRVFTKLMRPVISCLRSKGFVTVIYLDDILLIGYTLTECLRNIQETVRLLESLGLTINYKKSELSPTTRIKYLGFILNSETMTISLPDEKKCRVHATAMQMLNIGICTARKLAEFIGLLVSCTPGVRYGMIHTKMLERDKFIALSKSHGDYGSLLTISNSSKSDIHWWIKNIHKSVSPISNDSYSVELSSDASLTGWGAVSSGTAIHGTWSDFESNMSINYLELVAAYYGIRCFCRDLRNTQVLIHIDNTTALNYINRQGSIRFSHLHEVTKNIWDFCERRNLWIFATYITSSANFLADEQSRVKTTDTEWSLHNDAFSKISKNFGPFEVDLFASCCNNKCPVYYSWKVDPFSFGVDSFTVSWNEIHFYAFPPFCLILRTLQKIKSEKAKGVLVVPVWKSQPWFPLYMGMLDSKPIILKPQSDLLSFGSSLHPMASKLTLMAGILSGNL